MTGIGRNLPLAEGTSHGRFTPESRHAITDVRFSDKFVCFTPESGLKSR